MQQQLVPISFALTPRMQSFIEMRDALRCLSRALQHDSPYAWLPAAKDVQDLLIGSGNKKPAIPNIISLFGSMRKHYLSLAKKYPEFQDKLKQACSDIDSHAEAIHQHVPPAIEFLDSDSLLSSYSETIRTQDFLCHKIALPQVLQMLWHGDGRHGVHVQQLLEPVRQAIEHVDRMFHSHVPWQPHTAVSGYDQITLHAQDEIGLIIIGLPQEVIAQGIIPSCSGFRSVVRIRFCQWQAGKAAQDLKQNQNYSLMMVPIS